MSEAEGKPTNYIRFWGVRGSYPAPFQTHLGIGGNTACVEIRSGDSVLILDAGTGIIPLGNALMEEPGISELNIVLTHYHWDHISGLPFFVPAFATGRSIRFYGPGNDPEDIRKSISHQMKAPFFPVETEIWLASIDYLSPDKHEMEFGSMSVSTFNVHHPGSTYGYRIELNGRTVVYASDNELAFIDQSIDRRKEEFDEGEKALLEAMRAEEKSRAIEFMQDVDVLIHDAQYTPEDYRAKRGWGHSCYVDTVNAAIDANVDSLYLFHLDPSYDDSVAADIHHSAMGIIDERKAPLQCHVAREGEIISLDD
ncbi:MAG: MBL fold metallo-hydrolase [Pseudomonadota bacterium]